jgi:hypothetical protein
MADHYLYARQVYKARGEDGRGAKVATRPRTSRDPLYVMVSRSREVARNASHCATRRCK